MGPTTRKPSNHTEYRTHPYPKKNTSSDMTSPTSPNPARAAACPWNPEDDARLMQARKDGMNWEQIAKTYFPTKTANACRKRHERLMDKRSNTEEWNSAKLEAMEVAYYKCRERMWKIVADEINEKWQTVESKCMEKGWKNLTSSGRSASRRGKPLDTTFDPNDFEHDSGFVDDHPQVDPHSASSVAHSHSSRRTVSNASSYPATPQLQYAPPPGPSMNQTMYQTIYQPPHHHFGHQHHQSIPSIQSLLASTSGPNPNTIVTTI